MRDALRNVLAHGEDNPRKVLNLFTGIDNSIARRADLCLVMQRNPDLTAKFLAAFKPGSADHKKLIQLLENMTNPAGIVSHLARSGNIELAAQIALAIYKNGVETRIIDDVLSKGYGLGKNPADADILETFRRLISGMPLSSNSSAPTTAVAATTAAVGLLGIKLPRLTTTPPPIVSLLGTAI